MVDTLIDLDFEVVEAPSAEDKLSMMESNLSPDLLITDHMSLGMNGAELGREIHARTPGPPIRDVSGYAGVHGIAPGDWRGSPSRFAMPNWRRAFPPYFRMIGVVGHDAVQLRRVRALRRV